MAMDIYYIISRIIMQPQTQKQIDQNNEIFVGRQPIIDRQGNTYAYELLFRGSKKNSHIDGGCDDDSTQLIHNCLNVMGYETITGGKKGFVNFTTNLLLNEDYLVLPVNSVVIELLETVEPTPDVIQACKKLKNAGYTLALDDFIYKPEFEPLLELADIIKIDFLLTDEFQRKPLVRLLKQRNLILLAEKVETQKDYEAALFEGFDYFQGYYFSKPEVIQGKQAPSSMLGQLQMLSEINNQNVEFDEINKIIQRDPALCYKLLKYLNSVSFSIQEEITSINQATTLLGLVQLRKWVSLLCTSMIAINKPTALTTSALSRARFCELIIEEKNDPQQNYEYFLCGLFSTIDAMLNLPMKEAINKLTIPSSVYNALTKKPSNLTDTLNLALAFETADFEAVQTLSEKLFIDKNDAQLRYREAIKWTDDFLDLPI